VSNKHRRRQNGSKGQISGANTIAKPSSHDLIYSHSQDLIAEQLKQADEQNNRAYIVMIVATTLIGAAVVLQAVIPSNCNTLISEVFQTVPITVLGVVYLETIVIATIGWGVRNFWGQADALKLYAYYNDKPERDTKDALTKYSVNACDSNEKQLKVKAFWIRFAMWALRKYVIVFVLFLISQAILHIAC
jgi:hypothetical protein